MNEENVNGPVIVWRGNRKKMKKQFALLLALPLWAAACTSNQTSSPSATPAPAQLPTAVYRVEIEASATAVKVGDRVTFTAAIIGNFGNPMYYIEITDQGDRPPGMFISLIPGNVIRGTTGSSAVLGLVATSVDPDRISATFSASSPGTATVRIGVNGEIAETDGTGRSFLNYVTIYSESVTIAATEE